MASNILRLRKFLYLDPACCPSKSPQFYCAGHENTLNNNKNKTAAAAAAALPLRSSKPRGCVDYCLRAIGYLSTTWWLLFFLYNVLPSPLPAPDPPGARLRREGLLARHPVVLVPGIVTGGLELWEGRPCADGLFRRRLWGGSSSFAEFFRRPNCWLDHMALDNETGLDPPGIRVRPVPGLAAADYFTPGYFVWAPLIENLARIGYEGKNMHMTSYDWRLSFHNTEVRDQSLSRLKSKIELMVTTNGCRKVVVVPHSMGALYFLYFMKWVETPHALGGGGGGPRWCATHIKAIMNIGPTFLGVPKAVSGLFSAEARDVAFLRTMAPGLLDSNILGLQTLQHMMRISRTWDAIHSLLPKGGEAIWGGIDWSAEEGYGCDPAKKKYEISLSSDKSGAGNSSEGKSGFEVKETAHYGRIISFGKMASQLPSSDLVNADYKKLVRADSSPTTKTSCVGVWTEYQEMSQDSIKTIAENKVYTAGTVLDLLSFVAPRLMQRANSHFSYGIAENLDEPKYLDDKYWSNPLETKLPDAPDIEMYCLYGVGIPTERSYVYKVSPSDRCNSIPFQIDSSADGSKGECLKGGVFLADGDQSVPVLSAGLMCAKGWRGRTRFNPSGMPTFVREYRHKPPANLLEGRGSESGAHVDIMGNAALIEDIMRVAAGANGDEMGADRIHSNILKMSERVKLKL